MKINREHIERFTKPQLVDQLTEALAEIRRVEEDDPLGALDNEAAAFHRCVKALSPLVTKSRNNYGLTSESRDVTSVARVLGYLRERYGLATDDAAGLRSRLADAERERDEARMELEGIRQAIAPYSPTY